MCQLLDMYYLPYHYYKSMGRIELPKFSDIIWVPVVTMVVVYSVNSHFSVQASPVWKQECLSWVSGVGWFDRKEREVVHLWAIGVSLPGFVLELAVKTPPLFLTVSSIDVIPELRTGLENAGEEWKEERRKSSWFWVLWSNPWCPLAGLVLQFVKHSRIFSITKSLCQ